MIGVILANTGSPASPEPDDIETYLREFLMDDRIRQLPKPIWKHLLYKRILPKRKFTSAERYKFIWTEEGAPLITLASELADKIQRLFDGEESKGEKGSDAEGGSKDEGGVEDKDEGGIEGKDESGIEGKDEGTNNVEGDGNVVVRCAMSYGSPSLVEALGELRQLGVEKVVLLPLYPQSAFSPTMAVIDAFWRAQKAIGWHPESVVIDNYHDDPGYISAMERAIRGVGFDPSRGDRLVLSFHSIPLKDEAAGDTYRAQIAESVKLLAEKLGIEPDSIAVGFQCVFGPHKEKWAGPLSEDVLKEWRDGDFRVVFACPGFAIDCLETLYDIPQEIVPALEGEGATPIVSSVNGDIQAACNTSGRFVWVPALNASDEHAALLKAVIEKSL